MPSSNSSTITYQDLNKIFRAVFVSVNEADSNLEPANVVEDCLK